MVFLDSETTAWGPYEPSKDCSRGFCSVYCPHWCYTIFPPPPPQLNFSDDSDSASEFPPLVIAIIGILATAFLLVGYYTLFSKYCGSFEFLRRRRGNAQIDATHDHHTGEGDGGGSQLHHNNEGWRLTVSEGLDESVIRTIAVQKYRKGLIDETDCSVCLAEFGEDETLRLLPKCNHAFHMHCIDTWLSSHSNCPLCRSIVVALATTVPNPQQQPPEQESEDTTVTGTSNETVIAISDLERTREVVEEREDQQSEHRHGRSASMEHRVSIANILDMGMEENGSSSGENKESSVPAPMKRSLSSGRFYFPRHGWKGS
ncbi:E3 ubiquitin-protein ligase, ATL family [Zostera marina]|uniref:RING-type E3 ubiquitin transferase n=1 Tax=Zostera marina TaxID=29655 RepID=A0A0K9P1B5_ZOSMR|nr:E3 ubiquitin-protein ligase, ATL family [Zostera marina]